MLEFARGGAAFVEVAQANFEMQLMERLTELKNDKSVTPEQWLIFCKTLSGAVSSRKVVNAMRVEFEERAKAAAKVAEDAAKQGATGQEVVERMKEILGV